MADFELDLMLSAEDAAANWRKISQVLCDQSRQAGDAIRAMADSVSALGIGSFVKAAADAETERVLRAREEPDRG